jgi:phage terminase Nu1 subunit (DNA packaging protein)
MTYDDAMQQLSYAAHRAAEIADSEDGMPAHDLRELAAEVDCLISHNCTRKELADAEALYEGAKQAGLTGHDVEFVSVRGTIR